MNSMYNYLSSDNAQVDSIVADIINEIVARLHPRAVIIAGGFGRGEASVIEEDNRLRFLSDCEITLVSGKRISRKAINCLIADIYQRTSLEVVLHNSIMLLIFSSFPWLKRLFGKLWKPSILHYDLKHGAMVVFGENVLKKIPDVRPNDIPVWEGIRLIFNRMAAVLKYFPDSDERRDESIYWINKVILACQDALLLSVGQYHHSYKTRNMIFNELLQSQFGELEEKLPKFLSLASMATSYKLNPVKDAYPEGIGELWFDSAQICDCVFRYIAKNEMNIDYHNYMEFKKKYLEHPKTRSKYYVGMFSIPVLNNLAKALKMIADKGSQFPSIKLIVNIRTPWQQIIYSVLPLIYFGLLREGITDLLQLKQARDTISLFRRLEPQNWDPVEEWKYLKEQLSIIFEI